MELGNMIFGNSRGDAEVPRTPAFEGPWAELCEKLKIHWRGYAEEGCVVREGADGRIETELFCIRKYDWDAECDCGADDAIEAWFDAHPHGPECYQSELNARMAAYDETSGYAKIDQARGGGDLFAGMNVEEDSPAPGVYTIFATTRRDETHERWCAASDSRREFEEALFDDLCKKHGCDRQYGYAAHCTCGRRDASKAEWQRIGGHKDTCRFTQPNFLYKPTGFRINWYKYPFRDSYMTPPIKPAEWRSIVLHCIEFVTGAKEARKG